jgi:pilus assembly protein Flp/PilA
VITVFSQSCSLFRSIGQMVAMRSRAERGATMVEYALLVGLIAIAAVFAITALGGDISTLFDHVGNNIN